jgi:PAS domain S-box-containing protein
MNQSISVLILDDNKIVRTSFQRQFEDYKGVDFDIYLAKTLAEAKSIVDTKKIEFAIVDLHLPDGDGEEFITHASDVNSIVLSSSEDIQRRDTLFGLGIVDYFSKENPLNFVFSEVVKTIIEFNKNVGINILLASLSNNDIIKKVFRTKNYNLIEKSIDKELVNTLLDGDIHLLIIDIDDNYDEIRDILYTIRSKSELQSIPIFILSTLYDGAKEALYLKNGADDYICKDSPLEKLIIKAQKAISSYITNQELKILTNSLEELIDVDKQDLGKEIRFKTKELQDAQEIIDRYVMMTVTDIQGVITDITKAYEGVSGYTKEELIGKKHSVVQDSTIPLKKYKNIWNSLNKGKEWEGDFKDRSKNGDDYYIHSKIIPKRDSSGNLIGFYSLSEDKTDKITIQEQKRQLILQSKLASIGEMIAIISHQWKQPLAVISTTIQSLMINNELGKYDKESFERYFNTVLDSIDYMTETIYTFQDFFKPKMLKDRITPKEIIQKLDKILKATLKKEEITLKVNYIDSIEDKYFVTLKNELIQILINLITNAKDALVENGIKERLIAIDIKRDSETMTIKVRDNAGGIPAEVAETLFEPYVSTKGEKGTGLGLYMSKLVATESLHGDISVKNIQDGAEFTLIISAI